MPNLTTPAAAPQVAVGLLLRPPRVLLLEPDAEHAQQLADQLTADEMDIVVADSRVMAASRLRGGSPDVAIVRAELPEGSGYAVVDTLRAAGVMPGYCHVIAISDRAQPADRVRALNRGCVDFLALPLFYVELHQRVQLALTRTSATELARQQGVEVRGGLRLNVEQRTVTVHGQPVTLTKREWDLLVVLASDPERVVPKAELLQVVWGHPAGATTRTADSHACRLRNKLRSVGGDYVHSVWGVGYRLVPQALTT